MDRIRLKEEAEKFFSQMNFTDERVLAYLDEQEEVDRVVDGEELTFRVKVCWNDKSKGNLEVMVAVNDNGLYANFAPPTYGESYQLSPESMAEIARKQAEKRTHRRWRLPFWHKTFWHET